jgi:hypothetical protein
MKITSTLYKVLPSAINVVATFILTLPFLLLFGMGTSWKVVWVLIFFLYNVLFEYWYDRSPGMMIFETVYESRMTLSKRFLYLFLYTVSFASLVFHEWFPFDLFILNGVAQFICVQLTGTTIHGLLSGVKTVRRARSG